MNRRNFFKGLVTVTAGAVIAPTVILEATKKVYRSPVFRDGVFKGEFHTVTIRDSYGCNGGEICSTSVYSKAFVEKELQMDRDMDYAMLFGKI